MQRAQIQWFPGHMAKTRRMIKENLSSVDMVIEVLDSRIPLSSKNPEIEKIIGNKPLLSVLSKSSLADANATAMWTSYFKNSKRNFIFIDSITGKGIPNIKDAVFETLREKVERYQEKGMDGRNLKAMIVGIPNSGKSSLINKLSGRKAAKVEDRPGVTVDKQWVTTEIGITLLDMPGVLWPKFEDRVVAENLAITGAIKDQILNVEEIAICLVNRLRNMYPELLSARYKLSDMSEYEEYTDYELAEAIGRKRGFLISGGEVNFERTAIMLLDEFRAGTIGNITLERPKI